MVYDDNSSPGFVQEFRELLGKYGIHIYEGSSITMTQKPPVPNYAYRNVKYNTVINIERVIPMKPHEVSQSIRYYVYEE
mgnify:CR=1 FL=1